MRAQIVGADAAELLCFDVASVEWNNSARIDARAEHTGIPRARTCLTASSVPRHVAEPEAFDDEPADIALLKQQRDQRPSAPAY